MNPLSRRDFLQRIAASGGFVLGASLAPGASLRAFTAEDFEDANWEAHLFLTIGADGLVTIIAHRSEMGTGIRTALPMALADELEADWAQVRIEQALGDRRYGSQNTDGSRSVRESFEKLRRVGATARHQLESAAAARWGVPRAECRGEQHFVRHAASGRSLGYGDLAADAAKLEAPAKEDVLLKTRAEWRWIGKEGTPITDLDGLLDGSAQFGADVRLEGMLTAVIARPPVLGDVVKEYDDSAARAVKGVTQVVRMPDGALPPAFRPLGGVAVVARDTWSAIQGRNQLKLEWTSGPNAGYDSDNYREALLETVRQPGDIARNRGDVDLAFSVAEGVNAPIVEAEYTLPHLAHAPMEPPCAVARIVEDGCEIWAPTQNPQAAQDEVASALGMPRDKVRVHVTLLGGGFGRKSKPDYVVEAALLARETGAPVRVQWTREDEIRHGYYHAASAMRFRAALAADGMPSAWLQRSAFPPIGSTFDPNAKLGSGGELGLGFTDVPFDLPNLRAEVGEARGHVRIGWFRSVCNVFHAFGVQSFADECAHAAGRDPLEYLSALIGAPRHWNPNTEGMRYSNYGESLETHPIDTGRLLAVLHRAAEAADWERKRKAGAGLGLAVHRSFCGYVAVVMEVQAKKGGAITIPRVDIAADVGLALHPDRVRAQMEGAVAFGISLARYGAITAKNGAIEQSNFHDYPIARFAENAREIHVHLVDSDAPSAGAGETGVPPVAPALANALFAATGERVRDLPLRR
ncbi:MAG: molybdopterin-dependent oxidoreductase [Planctomycetota bacterium]|nr:molybdopterin-dependent oxidoreductase [Planctomycetota bacterium]